jgi:prevent-host-death family protein
MKEIRATEAARHFSDVLDAVEHRGQDFVVTRAGRRVAYLGPARAAKGADLKRILRAHEPDPDWPAELRALREQVTVEQRSWPA